MGAGGIPPARHPPPDTFSFPPFARARSSHHRHRPTLQSLLLHWSIVRNRHMHKTLLGGLASLHDEISWFKKEAFKWDVPISGIVAQGPNREYCRFLGNLMQPEVDYAACMTAFWAIEMVYRTKFRIKKGS